MEKDSSRFIAIGLLVMGILVVFVGRTLLAVAYPVPHLFELFDALTVLGSLAVLYRSYKILHKSDWIIAVLFGAVVGIGMVFSTLFSPYPVLGIVRSRHGQAIVRAIYTLIATLGGLVIMRLGGPVRFHIANDAWRVSGKNILLGLLIGLPLAVLNIFALQLSEGRAVSWQNPWTAVLDALQPGIVEEVVYRFALLGLLWLLLRKLLPNHADWLAGLLAMLVHNFAHFDALFLQAPLVALGMGAVMAVLWGLPPTILVLGKDLESAVAFHWIQDAARFLTGF